LTRFDSAKSTRRYRPPNGTAGLARSAVRGIRRLPSPPARTMARTRGAAMVPTLGPAIRRSQTCAPNTASVSRMRVDLLTREYPPHVYGGAGVHVTELAAVLRRHVDVRVRCFEGPRGEPGVTGYDVPAGLAEHNPALRTLGVDLLMAGDVAGADLVHSHTWYANLGGHVAGLLHGVPHVVTAHSLEPLRPWKAEQLGGGYALSAWAERTAYEHADAVIAVSGGMRDDILRVYPHVHPDRVHVVHNGIDLAAWRRPARPSSSSAVAPASRACPTSCGRPSTCPATSSSASARAPRTRRSSPGR